MSHVPPGFLNKPKSKIKMSDIAVLLFNVKRGAQLEAVGFEDANRTIESLIRQLNRAMWVDRSILESCLWSCNLLNEKNKFWHPTDKSFDDFLKDLIGNVNFDRFYNTIEGSSE